MESDAASTVGGGFETSMREYEKRKSKDCKYYFSKLDYEILRPLLIYKYEREEMHRQDDFLEMMMSDQNLLGSVYAKIDHNQIRRNSQLGSNMELSHREMQVARVSQAVQHISMQILEKSDTNSKSRRNTSVFPTNSDKMHNY